MRGGFHSTSILLQFGILFLWQTASTITCCFIFINNRRYGYVKRYMGISTQTFNIALKNGGAQLGGGG